jgi:hypothetical protein
MASYLRIASLSLGLVGLRWRVGPKCFVIVALSICLSQQSQPSTPRIVFQRISFQSSNPGGSGLLPCPRVDDLELWPVFFAIDSFYACQPWCCLAASMHYQFQVESNRCWSLLRFSSYSDSRRQFDIRHTARMID